MRRELLFRGGELRHSLEAQERKMREAVDAEPEEILMQADAEAWAAALAHHYAVDCPRLKLHEIWMEPPKDVTVDVSGDRGRYFSDYAPRAAYEFPGYRTVVHVPFEGDAGVFQLRTSTFTTIWPQGDVGKGELLLVLEYAHDRTPNIDGEVEQFTGLVDKYLGWAREEIETFNASLEQRALQVIEARRQRVARRDEQLAQSSIPIRRTADTKRTYISDALVRLPTPTVPQTRADDKPPKLEPVLEDKVFEHVLGVMRKQCLHIEQNPTTYTAMGEEDRRNVILSALTTHYEGFTAETDNQGGHTDILGRQEGRNVFICECKFWAGPESFTATIDQLFGYTGWRDTKLAIVMFVREKGMTTLLKKALATLKAHPQFVSLKRAASETELRATMNWPDDPERRADLNVFFVHTPETKRSRAARA